MLVTELGRVAFVNELHHSKVLSSIHATELGMFILIKELQPVKAPVLIDITESGIVILVSVLHHPKALVSMIFISEGIVICDSFERQEIIDFSFLLYKILSIIENVSFVLEILTLHKFLHCWKIPPPRFVTESGILMLVKELHP